jgi:hypothetical protein
VSQQIRGLAQGGVSLNFLDGRVASYRPTQP